MLKSLSLAALFAGSITAASAADLPSRLPPPPAPVPLPVFTWTGFYAGVNAGYATDDDRVFTTGNTLGNAAILAAGLRPTRFNMDSDGFTGGGQIGYNYQLGGLGMWGPGGVVIGIEADAAFTDLNRNKTYVGATGLGSKYHTGLDYLGTVRGRVGYAFDRMLVYGTGGFAYGESNFGALFTGQPAAENGSFDKVQTGYAVGGGVEYALPTNSFLNFFHSSAVTIRGEYLYYNLGRTTIHVAPAGFAGAVPPYSARFGNQGNIGRVAINYKF